MASLAYPVSLSGAIVWSLAALAGYLALTVTYNLYFHPLRHYPGPLLHRASRVPRAVRILRGRWTRDLLGLAERYGPVVRVAPGVLVYTGAAAWRDVFAHAHANGAVARGEEFAKDARQYRSRGVPPNLLAESRANHALLRRQLSHGFSDRGLRAQEGVIRGYVDLLVRRLRERCDWAAAAAAAAAGEEGEEGEEEVVPGEARSRSRARVAVDMKDWLNFTTFDVIGDLALGEPFGCLEKGEMDPRVALLDAGLQTANKTFFAREMGFERFLPLVFRRAGEARARLIDQMQAVLRRRMALGAERPDLIEGLLKKQEDWNMTFEGIRTNATLLIIAGSETTATLLSGTIYLLLRNPDVLEKLRREVRSAFPSDGDITFSSVDNLPYLIACLREALRYYPPVAGEMSRVVPRGGAHIDGRFVPEGTTVSAAQYPMNHLRRNFADPGAFRPERFLEPDGFPGDDLDVLQPFSHGPRNCIGKNLANAEMRTVLARLVYNFDMELVDPSEDWLDQDVWFLWRKPPLNVYLTPVQ